MKKVLFVLIMLSGFLAYSQSNYTYEINEDVIVGNMGIVLEECYLKSVGVSSMSADSVIEYSHYAFYSRYQSIICFLQKEGEFIQDSIPPENPTEGYIRKIIKSEGSDQGDWADNIGKYACYESNDWEYYNATQKGFRIYGLQMNGKLTTCYKLDATCFRNTILANLKNQLGNNISIIADPSGNSRE